jgi:hypothetical protein
VNHKDGNSVSFNVKSSPLVDTLIVGSDGDSCFVSVSASAVEFNGKPRMFVYLENHSMDKVLITGTGTSGKINFWNAYTDNFEGFYGTFSADNMPWASNGNTDITISDFPCGDSIISVAAYTTKNHWTSVNLGGYSYSTTFGSLASFSSHGPRVDGLSKPDIAAPGFGVVSSVNSFDTSFSANHSMVPYVVKNYKYGNVNYKYAIMSGTSMASPMVCGVVALMLEKNPNLTPSEIRNILQSTATVDTFVTNTNNPNLWGAGKLNAWAAMKAIDGITDVETQEQPDQVEALIYPNPSNGTFNIDLKDMATVSEIKIYDLLGNCVFTRAIETIGKQMITINAENLSEGQYFVEVMGSAGMRLLKLVIRK